MGRSERTSQPEGPFVDLATASEEEVAGVGISRMFFPLRGGVELFTDPTMPAAVARAKQVAILYDEVVFEPGLYEVSIAEDGSQDGWTPPEALTDEHLARSRRIQTPGTHFSVAVGPSGGNQAFEVIGSPLLVAYASEYHTGILDELAIFRPDWIKVATLGSNPLPMRTAPGDLWRAQQRADRSDGSLMPEDRRGPRHFRREWIIKTFNQDVVASSLIGASFNPTSLFMPMVQRRGSSSGRFSSDGSKALELWVPSLSGLPWEAVVEFCEHGGSTEARAMLREFEEKAAREEPEDANVFLWSVQREINEALVSVLEDQRPRWPEKIAEEAAKSTVGLIPVVGQIASPALTAAELGTQWARERRSWTAALMILSRRS